MVRLALWMVIVLFVAACSTAAPAEERVIDTTQAEPETPTQVTENDGADPDAVSVDAEPEAVEEPVIDTDTNSYDGPQWASLELVDARTGDSFTLADFAGKTVFLEPMATWCSNCRAQQGAVAQAMSEFSDDEVVFISLSVEAGIQNDTLSAYAERNNFPQIFVAASPELLNALIGDFGRTIANPPATPHFTIAPDGTVSSLSTGFHSSADVIAEINAAQNS